MKKQEDFHFFEDVYEVVRKVPGGRVTTYGAIARFIGAPGAARMVGWAMNGSHTAVPPVPAQRVVNRNGLLTGRSHFGADFMQELLEQEGHVIIDNQVQNFDKVFWDPNLELS